MSRISELGKSYERLPSILDEYLAAIDDVKDILSVKGKTIKQANREMEYQFFYDEKKAELEILVKYFEVKVDATRSRLFRNLVEKSPRELSDRARDKYIDNENDYLMIKEIYLEVLEIYEKYKSISDAFKSRGYALNNITRSSIAQVEENVI